MKLGTFKKQPAERLRYTIDYTCWLAESENITGFSYVFATEDTGVGEPTLDIDDLETIQTDKGVSFVVIEGTDGVEYKLTTQIQTDASQLREDEIYYEIADI